MAEPADSTATATLLLNDNRTAVMGRNAAGGKVVVLPTLPDGLTFTAQKAGGTAASGTAVTGTPTVPAFLHSSTDVETVTVPIDHATLIGAGKGSKFLRKQFFKSAWGGPSDGKWCYVNKFIQPLDANGLPTTVALAVDANTTPLTALGQAMTNYAQPGPLPGTYGVSERQQGYSRYIGWTAQKG